MIEGWDKECQWIRKSGKHTKRGDEKDVYKEPLTFTERVVGGTSDPYRGSLVDASASTKMPAATRDEPMGQPGGEEGRELDEENEEGEAESRAADDVEDDNSSKNS